MGVAVADSREPAALLDARFPIKRSKPRVQAFEVWFEADSQYAYRDLKERLAVLAVPEFRLDDLSESARRERPGGRHTVRWHCRFSELCAGGDDFATLRLLKLLTGAGYRLLRFDASAGE